MKVEGQLVDVDEVAALARRAQDGDEPAFAEMVEVLTPLLWRLCLRLCASERDAEDAVQETFVRAWQNLPRLRDPQATVAWVCRIARNISADSQRARARRPALSLDAQSAGGRTLVETLAAEQGDPAMLLHGAEARRLVRSVIDELPPKFGVVLALREIDGMSYEQIGAALGIKPGTVESRLHRARKKLAARIKALAQKGES